MRRASLALVSLLALLLVAAFAGAGRADERSAADSALSAVRGAVDARYHAVHWVRADTLASWLASDAPPQLLDSRARAEFELSHLPGAVFIDPDHPDFRVVDADPARRVVVYCSVGWRSGAIAQQLGERGRHNVYNLEEGIFGWANEGRPLVRGTQRATRVHPYDEVWGRMLHPDRRAALR
ncbi:MAG: rhodanese-like domain-containing protein [Polyangiales bacterium]|nr:rhodanese-like domain-containing protein [Myxococcales bacterium]